MTLIRRFLLALALAVAFAQGVCAQDAVANPPAAPGPVVELPAGATRAAGTPLALVIGELPVPFAHRLLSDELSLSTSFGLSATQEAHLVPEEGPLAGQRLRLRVRYIVPENVEQGFVQAAIRKESEKIAADARTRLIKPLRIDDFDFTVADAVAEEDGAPVRSLRLMGHVNGALVNVFLSGVGESEDVSALVSMLSGLRVDYTKSLQVRGRLVAEGKRVVVGGQLLSVLGTLPEPKDFDARLLAAVASHDGEGRLVGASHTFGFFKVGFWAVQNFAISLACQSGLPKDEAGREALRNPFEGEDNVTRISRSTERIGGLEAVRDTVRLSSATGELTDVSRWYAEVGDTFYVVRIDRRGSRNQQVKLERQLQAMHFRCTPASGLFEAMPVAPPAAAGEPRA